MGALFNSPFESFRKLPAILWRLFVNLWVLAFALAAGACAAWLVHHYGWEQYFPGIEKQVVDAVIGALGSSLTVYVLALTVQIEEVSEAARKAAYIGVAQGFLGSLDASNLRRALNNEITELPLPGALGVQQYLLDPKKRFPEQITNPGNLRRVSLGVVAGERYHPDELKRAAELLYKTYNKVFSHIVVLDKASGNIVAASPVGRGFAHELWMGNINAAEAILEETAKGVPDCLLPLEALGFATLRFDVTHSVRDLLYCFVENHASEALLSFGKGDRVVGQIELWKLVRLALQRDPAQKARNISERDAA